jgi:acyl-CoA reductase-like NAD-dependent aldehyde dehydrogenase
MTTGPFAQMSATQRGKLLRNLGDLLVKHGPRLAEIEVRDNGKLLTEMAAQLKYQPETWYYYAGLADKVEGSVIPVDKPDHLVFTSHEPLGVVGALTA